METSKEKKKMNEKLDFIDFIKSLREDSFEGWDEEAVKGYLTALTTMEEKIKSTVR